MSTQEALTRLQQVWDGKTKDEVYADMAAKEKCEPADLYADDHQTVMMAAVPLIRAQDYDAFTAFRASLDKELPGLGTCNDWSELAREATALLRMKRAGEPFRLSDIEEAMVEHWGPRCNIENGKHAPPDVRETCFCCQVWDSYDALVAAAQGKDQKGGSVTDEAAGSPALATASA